MTFIRSIQLSKNSLSLHRLKNLWHRHFTHSPKNGGAERDRTADPLVANQVLSQLSYSPFKVEGRRLDPHLHSAKLVNY